jgi:hypothetical protein
MSRFANLADKPKSAARPNARSHATSADGSEHWPDIATAARPPASRIGRKAISAYFSPEMSLAMHVCARKQGISLQALMAEAFDDVLRKYGESPIGD